MCLFCQDLSGIGLCSRLKGHNCKSETGIGDHLHISNASTRNYANWIRVSCCIAHQFYQWYFPCKLKRTHKHFTMRLSSSVLVDKRWHLPPSLGPMFTQHSNTQSNLEYSLTAHESSEHYTSHQLHYATLQSNTSIIIFGTTKQYIYYHFRHKHIFSDKLQRFVHVC